MNAVAENTIHPAPPLFLSQTPTLCANTPYSIPLLSALSGVGCQPFRTIVGDWSGFSPIVIVCNLLCTRLVWNSPNM